MWVSWENINLTEDNKKLKSEVEAGVNKDSVKNLTLNERLSRHIVLPEGEQSKVEIVQDVEDFKKNNPAFQNVSSGDIRITFANLDLVYSPGRDVLIGVSSSAGKSEKVAGASVQEKSESQGPISLEIRNGSGVAGAAGKTASRYTDPKVYTVLKVGNAGQIYTGNVVVNLKGKNVIALESEFQTQAVSALPSGESSSDADVVVILGK